MLYKLDFIEILNDVNKCKVQLDILKNRWKLDNDLCKIIDNIKALQDNRINNINVDSVEIRKRGITKLLPNAKGYFFSDTYRFAI